MTGGPIFSSECKPESSDSETSSLSSVTCAGDELDFEMAELEKTSTTVDGNGPFEGPSAKREERHKKDEVQKTSELTNEGKTTVYESDLSEVNVIKEIKRQGRRRMEGTGLGGVMATNPEGINTDGGRKSDKALGDSGSEQPEERLQRLPSLPMFSFQDKDTLSSIGTTHGKVLGSVSNSSQVYPPSTSGRLQRKRRPRLEASLRFCRDFLTEVFSKKHKEWAWPLYKPDKEKIFWCKEPEDTMYLIDMKNKMADRKYKVVDEFVADIHKLVEAFCKAFPSDHSCHVGALKLRQMFSIEFKNYMSGSKSFPNLSGCISNQNSRVGEMYVSPFHDMRSGYPDFSAGLSYNMFGLMSGLGMMGRDPPFQPPGHNFGLPGRYGGLSPSCCRDELNTPPPPPEVTINSNGSDEHMNESFLNSPQNDNRTGKEFQNDENYSRARINEVEGDEVFKSSGDSGLGDKGASQILSQEDGKRVRVDDGSEQRSEEQKRIKIHEERDNELEESQEIMTNEIRIANIKSERFSEDEEEGSNDEQEDSGFQRTLPHSTRCITTAIKHMYCEWILSAVKIFEGVDSPNLLRKMRSLFVDTDRVLVNGQDLQRLESTALKSIVMGIINLVADEQGKNHISTQTEQCGLERKPAFSQTKFLNKFNLDLYKQWEGEAAKARASSYDALLRIQKLQECLLDAVHKCFENQMLHE